MPQAGAARVRVPALWRYRQALHAAALLQVRAPQRSTALCRSPVAVRACKRGHHVSLAALVRDRPRPFMASMPPRGYAVEPSAAGDAVDILDRPRQRHGSPRLPSVLAAENLTLVASTYVDLVRI